MSRVRANRTHGSTWQGLETDDATDGELGTTRKPAWNRSAPNLRHAPRQPLTLPPARHPISAWHAQTNQPGHGLPPEIAMPQGRTVLPGWWSGPSLPEPLGDRYDPITDAGSPAPPAQIQTCALTHPAPALSTDGKSLRRPRVEDGDGGPVIPAQRIEPFPAEAVPLRPPTEDTHPEPPQEPHELHQRPGEVRSCGRPQGNPRISE